MPFFRGLTRKKLLSSASAERRKKEQDCYLKNGSAVLEELLALCNGNCRIPIRYFSAAEIEMAIKHSKNKFKLSNGYMVTGSLDERLVLVRFNECHFNVIHRDIALTAQMSHLKNVLRLVGCCLEFESPVMVYEYVEGISLSDLLYREGNHDDQTRKSLLSWGNRLRIANEVASAVVFLHTEFTTPIIHRNIKPEKVIIDQSSGGAKIVDFSLSISLPPGKLEVEDAVCGTYCYIDPEYAISGTVTQKVDVYSFGIFLFELLTGKEVRDIMKSNIREGTVMERMYSAILEETIDLEENAKFNIEEDNVMNRVDSILNDTEEGNAMDRVDFAILEQSIDFKNLPINFVNRYIKVDNVVDMADPTILEEHGIEIQQQLENFFHLVKRCTSSKGEDRPYMIHVARELRRIEKCFRALTLGQN